MGLPVFDTLLDIIKGPIDKLVPDKNDQQRFNHELEMAILKSGLGQMEINKAEAQHTSIFVAGWRPFIGWVCGFALAWHFIGFDLLNWILLAFSLEMSTPPSLSGTETLITVLLSMLGLGGLRTVEKVKGVSRDSWSKAKKGL